MRPSEPIARASHRPCMETTSQIDRLTLAAAAPKILASSGYTGEVELLDGRCRSPGATPARGVIRSPKGRECTVKAMTLVKRSDGVCAGIIATDPDSHHLMLEAVLELEVSVGVRHVLHERIEPPKTRAIDVVFECAKEGPDLRFVEVEDEHRRGIKAGTWVERSDGFSVLRLTVLNWELPDDGAE